MAKAFRELLTVFEGLFGEDVVWVTCEGFVGAFSWQETKLLNLVLWLPQDFELL